MKRSVIWGCGQAGRMLLNLFHPEVKVVAFCDSDPSCRCNTVSGIRTIGPEELSEIRPDVIYIAILNKEACAEVEMKLKEMGFNGQIITITEFRRQFDVRLATLRMIAEEVKQRRIKGAVAELGVYKGDFATEISRIFPDRKIYLFDTFEGFDIRDTKIEEANQYSRAVQGNFSDTSEESVYSRLPHPDKAVFMKGFFPDTADGLEEEFAFVSLDADLYHPMYEGMNYFYPRMSTGGYMLIHDYNNSQFFGAGEAVKQFMIENNIYAVPLCDIHGSAAIIKR